MRKETVFDAIMQGDYEDISPLAELLRKRIDYSVIKQPRQELIMFRVEENVEKLDFNVGEVLMTSAEVRVGDSIGYSAVMNLNEEMALDCALLMGVYEEGGSGKDAIEALALGLIKKREEKMRCEREIVSSTRVDFELMAGQDENVSHNNPGEKG